MRAGPLHAGRPVVNHERRRSAHGSFDPSRPLPGLRLPRTGRRHRVHRLRPAARRSGGRARPGTSGTRSTRHPAAASTAADERASPTARTTSTSTPTTAASAAASSPTPAFGPDARGAALH